MKITEKLLLDNCKGMTAYGAHLYSEINGKTIYWTYRWGLDDEGYNPAVSDRKLAREITLELDRWATIELDPECADHPALKMIEREYEALASREA